MTSGFVWPSIGRRPLSQLEGEFSCGTLILERGRRFRTETCARRD